MRTRCASRATRHSEFGISQYHCEAEILLPPVTVLQVLSHRIEQDVVIVTLRPTLSHVIELDE